MAVTELGSEPRKRNKHIKKYFHSLRLQWLHQYIDVQQGFQGFVPTKVTSVGGNFFHINTLHRKCRAG